MAVGGRLALFGLDVRGFDELVALRGWVGGMGRWRRQWIRWKV